MTAEFIALIQSEATATIEGLTGKKPTISNSGVDSKDKIHIDGQFAFIELENASGAKIILMIPANLATALSDLMLGGEGASSESISNDDLDAVKEIASNIFGAVATALKGQKELPKMEFKVADAKILQQSENLSDFSQGCSFDFKLDGIAASFSVLFSKAIMGEIDKSAASPPPQAPANGATSEPAHHLNPTETRNINMLLDIKMQVKVRIGQKKMLLKDVISMDIGSVIELNQLANDPLEILVGDKVIAKGEVVIIDGNFGIQITEIGSKKERLEQIRG